MVTADFSSRGGSGAGLGDVPGSLSRFNEYATGEHTKLFARALGIAHLLIYRVEYIPSPAGDVLSVRFAGTRSRKRMISCQQCLLEFVVGVVAAAVGFGFVPAIRRRRLRCLACPSGYYENVDGQRIPAPRQVPLGSAPPGATAICRDGSPAHTGQARVRATAVY